MLSHKILDILFTKSHGTTPNQTDKKIPSTIYVLIHKDKSIHS